MTGHDSTRSRLGRVPRAAVGALIGLVPGLLGLLMNAALVQGEAALTLGVVSILATISGGIVGAVLGAHTELRARPMALGAVLGALPGAAMFLFVGIAAPIFVVLGAVYVGLSLGRRDAERESAPVDR